MKNILGILLVLIIISPPGFLYLSFHKERGAVRNEVRAMLFAGMDRDKLVVLSFSLQDAASLLSWKDRHEFEYRGRMFDVVETDILEDSVSYLCWPDDEETRLNRKLDELVAKALGSDPQKRNNSNRLVDFLKIQFVQCGIQACDGLVDEGIVQFPRLTLLYTSVFIIPDSPPPQLSC